MRGVVVSRRYKVICLLWLLVAMLWGIVLRWFGVQPIEGLNYRFALHTHSHLALLGWVYMGFYVLLGERFLAVRRERAFGWLFWFQQACLLGMLLSFPFQGYAAVSIGVSTAFVFGSYVFCWWLYRDCRDKAAPVRGLARASAVFLALSSLGPYAVGYFKAQEMSDSPWYANSLYFYLHFLYNGFFIFGLLALIFARLDRRRLERLPAFEVPLFVVGASLGYLLSILWMQPGPIVYALAAGGAALQFMIWIRWLKEIASDWRARGSGWQQERLLYALLILLMVKLAMQLASSVPEIADWLFVSQRYTIIGYIHFVMLGILTPFLYMLLFGKDQGPRWPKLGAALYGLGVLVTEVLLFGTGVWSSWHERIPYAACLFGGYALVMAGTALAARRAMSG